MKGLFILIAMVAAASIAWHSGAPIVAAQFPGQGDATKRSRSIIDRERDERHGRMSDNEELPRILVPGKDDRIQLDRWTYGSGVSGVDPLTQIIRFDGKGSSGTGFLVDECRVMTNLHVISAERTIGPQSLVGKEYEIESLPIPWLDNARARSRVIILGHGAGHLQREDGSVMPETADQDWAIGYDIGCASRRYDLGTIHLGPSAPNISEMRSLRTFTAGFTAVRMPGLSPWEFPLYIDTDCRLLKKSDWATSASHFETNCSMESGGSGQPFLSGLLADPQNPRIFQSENGRPRLFAYALFHAGGGYNAGVPNFVTRAFVILFDQEMMRRFKPFLHGPVDPDTIRAHSADSSTAMPVLQLHPRYTEEARRRRIQGRLTIDFIVRADGTVERATLVDSLDPGGLDDLMLNAAEKWLFAPAKRDGVPIRQSVRLWAQFELP